MRLLRYSVRFTTATLYLFFSFLRGGIVGLDWIGLEWDGMGWDGELMDEWMNWIGVDWIGLKWIGLDWTGWMHGWMDERKEAKARGNGEK